MSVSSAWRRQCRSLSNGSDTHFYFNLTIMSSRNAIKRITDDDAPCLMPMHIWNTSGNFPKPFSTPLVHEYMRPTYYLKWINPSKVLPIPRRTKGFNKRYLDTRSNAFEQVEETNIQRQLVLFNQCNNDSEGKYLVKSAFLYLEGRLFIIYFNPNEKSIA